LDGKSKATKDLNEKKLLNEWSNLNT